MRVLQEAPKSPHGAFQENTYDKMMGASFKYRGFLQNTNSISDMISPHCKIVQLKLK